MAEAEYLSLYNFVTKKESAIIGGVIYLRMIQEGVVLYIDKNGQIKAHSLDSDLIPSKKDSSDAMKLMA